MKKFLFEIKKKFSKLGPGFITGAADDDPSGVATYSIAGAQFGYRLNFLSVFLIPLMYAVQEMCGRIGLTSGMGLAGVIKKYYSKKLLFFVIFLLLIANVINIGADLGIMAASLEMVFGRSFLFWLTLITVVTVLLEVLIPYKNYCHYLKWLGLTLCVYIVTALIVKQDLKSIAYYTLIPHLEFNSQYLMTMVGFLGTTISPYLFFWQAAEEVEENIKNGRVLDFDENHRVVKKEIKEMRDDTKAGMIFSNLITFFILLTTSATLHRAGIFNIQTPQQAALALKPLAGHFAYLLFTIGIIGIGLQSVPILAGGVAYAFCEAFGFKRGLSKNFNQAKVFYCFIGLVTFLGAVLNLTKINVISFLYYAAIVNGIIAVPLIYIIMKLSGDKRIVGRFRTTNVNKIFSWLAFVFMGISVLLMLVTSF